MIFMLRVCTCSGRWQQLRLPDEEKRRRSRCLRISVQFNSVQNVDRIRVLSVADPGGSRPAGQPDPPELRLDQIIVSRRRRRRQRGGSTVVRDGVWTGGGDEAEGGLLRGGVHQGAALRPSDRRVAAADQSTVRRLQQRTAHAQPRSLHADDRKCHRRRILRSNFRFEPEASGVERTLSYLLRRYSAHFGVKLDEKVGLNPYSFSFTMVVALKKYKQ